MLETGAQGLEPQLTEPESVVLPITPRPNRNRFELETESSVTRTTLLIVSCPATAGRGTHESCTTWPRLYRTPCCFCRAGDMRLTVEDARLD